LRTRRREQSQPAGEVRREAKRPLAERNQAVEQPTFSVTTARACYLTRSIIRRAKGTRPPFPSESIFHFHVSRSGR
jgi:hypothetical protein